MTKQSEAAKTYFIGHDPGQEQRRHPTMGRLDEGIQDPLQERMILLDMRGQQPQGRMGHRFAFIKRMTFYFVYLSDWKTKCIATEMTQFSPIIECLSLFVTLKIIAQMAQIKAFLCKINKKVQRGFFMQKNKCVYEVPLTKQERQLRRLDLL